MKQASARRHRHSGIAAFLAVVGVVVGLTFAVAPVASADTVVCHDSTGKQVSCSDPICTSPIAVGCTTTTIPATPTTMATTTTTTGACYDAAGARVPCDGDCVQGVDRAGNPCDQGACFDAAGKRVDCSGPCVDGLDTRQQPCIRDCIAGTSDKCPGTQDGCFDAQGLRIDCIGECVEGKDAAAQPCDPACVGGQTCVTTTTTTAMTTTTLPTTVGTLVTQVLDDSGNDGLAETGTDPTPLVWAAAGLLALGGVALYLGRRRRI